MKNFLLGVAATILALIVGGALYLRLGFAEVAADIPPSEWEKSFMTAAMHASVRKRAPDIGNPLAPTENNLIEGGKLYIGGCGGCHGMPGKPPAAGDELYPPIPQLPSTGTKLSEGQIFWVAKHGIRYSGMFANGKFEPDEKLWKMAAYIARIKNLPPLVQDEVSKQVPK
jgi:mono/diheme cytochrome c family protein